MAWTVARAGHRSLNSLLSKTSLALAVALVTSNVALAQAAPGAAASPFAAVEQMVPLLLVFAVMYILIIRPQQKKRKEHDAFLSQIKRGDEIVTASGILGRIEGLTDQFVTLEIAPDVRIKVLRSQVAGSATALTSSSTTAGAKA